MNVKDASEFAGRLNLLMNDQELRKLWQAWASKYVKQFNYQRIANLYLENFKTALKGHH